MREPIPFVDLSAQHQRLNAELEAAFARVLEDGAFIQGRHAEEFAQAFSAAHDLPPATGCANGTAALSIALECLGIGPGDEVITPAHCFIATAEAIFRAGAVPVWADIDPATYNLDAKAVEAALTPATKAILAVHLYGTPAPVDVLAELAGARGIALIEDCAQAHLAELAGKKVGTFGDAACFSFYPSKNLGALGDAGLVALKDKDANARAREIIDHGRAEKYRHEEIGFNYRMDGLQAAYLSVKLPYLAAWNDKRRANARLYDQALKARGFKVIEPAQGSTPVYHLYVAEVSNRDEVAAALTQAGIGFGIHYPVPLHRQPAVTAQLGGGPALPETERAADRIISLPMCAEIEAAAITRVLDVFLSVAET